MPGSQSTNAALERYNSSATEARPALMPATEAACIGDIEMASRHYQTLVELAPLTHGNKRRVLRDMQSHDALVIADRYQAAGVLCQSSVNPLMDRIDALIDQLDALPDDALTERIRFCTRPEIRVELLSELEQIETAMRDLNLWYERITVSTQKAQLTARSRGVERTTQ